jgi:hypothetical protein
LTLDGAEFVQKLARDWVAQLVKSSQAQFLAGLNPEFAQHIPSQYQALRLTPMQLTQAQVMLVPLHENSSNNIEK